ncbi:MAG: YdeI/OmpD-associated family protein [Burkholderiales bacterium]|nr:YdeI/OmpD-associated family protein [Burkholderiales bacterium]
MPPLLAEALARNATARSAFSRLAPSHREEYLRWILDAKKEETQRHRVWKTLELIVQNES